MPRSKIFSTDDILVFLCSSVTKVLSRATNTTVAYSPMVQKITRTCLRPDIGCFALFDGGFSGLVVINFSAAAALEIYRDDAGAVVAEFVAPQPSALVTPCPSLAIDALRPPFTARVGGSQGEQGGDVGMCFPQTGLVAIARMHIVGDFAQINPRNPPTR